MTSVHIEASRQARQATFRPAVECSEGHVQSIDEQIENFCTRCARLKSISSNQEGRAS